MGGAGGAQVCGAVGFSETRDLDHVYRPDRGKRVLCEYHKKAFLGVST